MTVSRVVSNHEEVARHAFLPFLGLDSISWKVARGDDNKLRRTAKVRPIRYAAHLDSAIYSYYSAVLATKYEAALSEEGMSDHVIAFRSLGKSNIEFASEAFNWIESHETCVAFGFDVRDFFGSLDHKILKQQWVQIINAPALPSDHFAVFKSLTRYAYANLIEVRRALNKTRSATSKTDRLCSPAEFRSKIRDAGLIKTNHSGAGIPQGSPLSAILSNIYMFNFDKKMRDFVASRKGFYRRYCDDILVILPSQHAPESEQRIKDELAILKLELQTAKTLRCDFPLTSNARPLQYLGLVYDGNKIMLRSSGISRYYKKMRIGLIGMSSGKAGKQKLIRRKGEMRSRYTIYKPKHKQNFHSYVGRVDGKLGQMTASKQMTKHTWKFNRHFESLTSDD